MRKGAQVASQSPENKLSSGKSALMFLPHYGHLNLISQESNFYHLLEVEALIKIVLIQPLKFLTTYISWCRCYMEDPGESLHPVGV